MTRRWPAWLVLAMCALGLGTAAAFVSSTLHPRFELRTQTIAQQMAIYERTPLVWDGTAYDAPSWRNRILVPYTLVAVRRVAGWSAGQAFLAVRWASAVGAFGVFAWAAFSLSGSMLRTLAALGLLLHVLVLSFNHGWEHPTDYADVAVIALGAVAIVRREFWWALAIGIAGAANRESSAFVGVAWAIVRLTERERPLRAVGAGVALSAAAYATAIALRLWNRMPGGGIGNDLQLFRFGDELAAALRQPFMSWPMLMLAALIPLVLFARSSDGPAASGFWRAAWIVGLAGAAIAQIDELRVSLPAFTLLLCAGLAGRPRDEWS